MRALTTALLVALAAPASAQIFDDASVGFPPGVLYPGQLDWMMPIPSGGATVVSAPLNATGPFLPEDSGTVAHVYWTGTALADTVGNSWSMNGTVPQTAANVSPFVPGKAGAGPYSAANNYQGSTSLMEWAGDWSVTVVFKLASLGANQDIIGKMPSTTAAGWLMRVIPTGEVRCYHHDGTLDAATTTNVVVANSITVATCGKASGSIYARMAAAASASSVSGAMTSASAEPVYIGRFGATTTPASVATIYEILASTTAYSDALHLARYQRVFGMLTQQGQAISVTRATDQTYTANSLVWSTPNDTISTGTDGVEVWKAATNSITAPSASCVAGAVGAGWALVGAPTCTADVVTAPNGDGMDEWVSASSAQSVYQLPTTASTTTAVASVWLQKAAGATASIQFGKPTAASGCACGTSDGSACSAAVYSTNYCKAVFSAVGTTPIRGWVSGTWSAGTSWEMYLGPGDIGVSTGTTRFGMAQVEPGLYPTPYTTATRNAGVVTTPLPDLGNRWCVSVTAKPGSGQVWTSGSGYLLLGGTSGAANSFYVTRNFFEVRDSAGGQKYVGTFGASVPATGGRLTACNNAGTLTMCANGAVIASTPTGAGTALWSSTPATLTVGSAAGSTVFDGALSNLKICKGATKCGDCR